MKVVRKPLSDVNLRFADLSQGDVFRFVESSKLCIKDNCDSCTYLDSGTHFTPAKPLRGVVRVPGAFVEGYGE